MKPSVIEKGLLYPFNMVDPEERSAMYNLKHSAKTTMVVYLLLHSDFGCCGGPFYGPVPWSEENPKAVLEAVARECIANSPSPEMDVEVIIGYLDGDPESQFPDFVPIQSMQDDWVTHGMYLQVAFRNDSMYEDFDWLHNTSLALQYGMIVDDTRYAQTHSVHPKDGQPIPTSIDGERNYRLVVGDVFKVGLGVWCEALRVLRNEVLVKCHATVVNEEDDDQRKPDEEWKKFLDAGMVHFLDYVTLLSK